MRLGVLLFALLLAPSAGAACRWEWTCDGLGHCRHVPLCDSALDFIPPEPPSIHPIAPSRVEPIPRPMIPPIGTQHCGPRQVRTGGGWQWVTVCE